ncbi:hypothetical protein Droror1_Dr00008287 [Drosera rotundifolia]
MAFFRKYFWAKAYARDAFFAGMTTRGRNQSKYTFFDPWLNPDTRVNEFVKQYDRALMDQRKAEEEEDFANLDSRPTLLRRHPIEEHVARCYTTKMFDVLTKEWKLALYSFSHESF